MYCAVLAVFSDHCGSSAPGSDARASRNSRIRAVRMLVSRRHRLRTNASTPRAGPGRHRHPGRPGRHRPALRGRRRSAGSCGSSRLASPAGTDLAAAALTAPSRRRRTGPRSHATNVAPQPGDHQQTRARSAARRRSPGWSWSAGAAHRPRWSPSRNRRRGARTATRARRSRARPAVRPRQALPFQSVLTASAFTPTNVGPRQTVQPIAKNAPSSSAPHTRPVGRAWILASRCSGRTKPEHGQPHHDHRPRRRSGSAGRRAPAAPRPARAPAATRPGRRR